MSAMNVFETCLRRQLMLHPSMTAQDVVKLCYQAACGAEHLLGDLNGAKAYFQEEYGQVVPTEEPLFEEISETICRVNFGAWKRTGMPAEWLFAMFTKTVFQTDGKQRLQDYLEAAESVLHSVGFDMTAWQAYVEAYKEQGMPAVRHSAQYRGAEYPAYRIVDRRYMDLLPGMEDTSKGFD